ncbi:MAG: AraC family transcriptional regulator [Oscillospiraceae bacterium]|jgi:AraC-like DNA-binding protein|nr:AraC family transcriptional regulator [Oscillospiraceae bacterium]
MNDRDGLDVVKDHIDNRFYEAITIDQLARLACMSPSKLKYSFRTAFGSTVYRYIMETRAKHAERLLVETDLPVARIAERVGYKKAGAFAAAFHKCVGKLPREARRGNVCGGRIDGAGRAGV